MGMLNHSSFPRLWRFLQWSIGGCCQKRRIVRDRIGSRKNVLDIGCSVGIIDPVFLNIPDLRYTGVDIDEGAVRTARQKYRNDRSYQFHQGEIEHLDLPEASFDLIILSAVLHHVDDAGCRGILSACNRLLTPDGLILIIDPVQPIKGDPLLVRFFNSIEQGFYVRRSQDLDSLMHSESSLQITERREFFLKGSPLGFPRITRCVTMEMRRANVDAESDDVAPLQTQTDLRQEVCVTV